MFGHSVQVNFPSACSVADYALIRFGPTAKIFVTCIVLFNMSIAMLADYTTIGAIFQDFVGSVNYGVIITVGVLTTVYTVYGGLRVSIVTDQAQAVAVFVLVILVTVYVAALFRPPGGLPSQDWGVNNASLAPNIYGYSSIFTMPISLLAATIFSDAMWQRVWAAESKTAVYMGGLIGSVTTIIVVFLCGFCGFLAAWANLIDWDPTSPTYTNPNLYLFQVFTTSVGWPTWNSPNLHHSDRVHIRDVEPRVNAFLDQRVDADLVLSKSGRPASPPTRQMTQSKWAVTDSKVCGGSTCRATSFSVHGSALL